jgi:TonB family protein
VIARPPPSIADLNPLIARVSGGPARGFPNSDDLYPLAERRAGTDGVTTVNVYVDPLGRLTAAPALATSSGSRDFDTAALDLARRGSGHYRPRTENGRAVSDCYGLRSHSRLRN